MTKMPPDGYPAFLQYLQSVRVSDDQSNERVPDVHEILWPCQLIPSATVPPSC